MDLYDLRHMVHVIAEYWPIAVLITLSCVIVLMSLYSPDDKDDDSDV
jgi:hypothetical protein